MVFEDSSPYLNKKYHIKYKDMFGKEHSIEGEASSKSDAERMFRRSFNNCEIIKTQTMNEWIKETAEEIVNGMMKNIKKDLKEIINPNNVKNINYTSKSFLKGLKKVNEKVEKSREMRIPDYNKKYLSYNI